MSYLILGIESSCDDTSAAVIRDEYLLSNVMASQEVHRNYGGVIPELASRAHQQNILPVVDQALKNCEKPITVAVMGCVVNGPGEAREADIGIAGGEDCGVLFVKGELKEKLPYDELLPALLKTIDEL